MIWFNWTCIHWLWFPKFGLNRSAPWWCFEIFWFRCQLTISNTAYANLITRVLNDNIHNREPFFHKRIDESLEEHGLPKIYS